MFYSLKLNKIFKNKLFYLSIIIVFFVISIIFYTNANSIIFGKKVNNINLDELFNINSYYSEYDMTVVSNKNINTYFVKEWFKEESFRYEHLDSINNTIITVINKDSVIIKNLSEKNILSFNNLNAQGNNLCFKTFAKIYNEIIGNLSSCDCKTSVYEKDNNINVVIDICNFNNTKCVTYNKLYNENARELLLQIDKKTMKPILLLLQDKSKNMLKGIIYTKFEIKPKIESEVFMVK